MNNIIYTKILSIFLFSILIFFSVPIHADFGWHEAGRHAMDGVFYLDYLSDGNIFQPVKYAMDYYSRYPAITPVMYPPFFGFAQIIGFFLIGIYPWVSRLTVVTFLGWGAWGLIKISEDITGKDEAVYSGMMYLAMPIVIYWGRDVMLEPPAMALVIWSFYHFLRYIKNSKTKHIVFCLLFAILAPYTKQNTVFIFPVFLCTVFFLKRKDIITDRRVFFGLCISAVCGLPLVYVTLRWGILNIQQSFGNLYQSAMTPFEHMIYYFQVLPDSIGWAGIILTCVFFFLSKKAVCQNNITENLTLLFSWAFLCYIQMVLIKIKEPRHGFFWIPVFAILAAYSLKNILTVIQNKKWRLITGTFLITGIFSANLANSKMNWSEGFGEPAEYLSKHWDGNAVLTNIERDASFIFHIRSLDAQRKFRVYRSSKIFESMMVYKSWGVTSFLKNKNQFLADIKKYGIRYILFQEPMSDMTRVEKLIRESVDSEHFEKIKEFPIIYPDNKSHILCLYRYKGAVDSPGIVPAIYLPIIDEIIPADTQ